MYEVNAGYEAPAQYSEETRNAAKNVPWAMVLSVVATALCGGLHIASLLFSVQVGLRLAPMQKTQAFAALFRDLAPMQNAQALAALLRDLAPLQKTQALAGLFRDLAPLQKA